MCYNCGCGMKEDDMGDVRNITIIDLAKDAHVQNKNGAQYIKDFSVFIDGIDTNLLDQTIAQIKNSDAAKNLSGAAIDINRIAKAAIASQMNAQQTLEEVIKLLHQTSAQELDQKIAATPSQLTPAA